MFCNKCGKNVSFSDGKCKSCGAAIVANGIGVGELPEIKAPTPAPAPAPAPIHSEVSSGATTATAAAATATVTPPVVTRVAPPPPPPKWYEKLPRWAIPAATGCVALILGIVIGSALFGGGNEAPATNENGKGNAPTPTVENNVSDGETTIEKPQVDEKSSIPDEIKNQLGDTDSWEYVAGDGKYFLIMRKTFAEMPNVADMAEGVAKGAIKKEIEEVADIDFDNFIVEYKKDERTKGAVIEAKPAVGTKIKSGDKITLVVSKGPNPEMKVVPDVTGCTIDEAKEKLQAEGFVLRVAEAEVKEEEKTGKVILQAPEANKEIEESSTVTITIGVKKNGNNEKTVEPESKEFVKYAAEVWYIDDDGTPAKSQVGPGESADNADEVFAEKFNEVRYDSAEIEKIKKDVTPLGDGLFIYTKGVCVKNAGQSANYAGGKTNSSQCILIDVKANSGEFKDVFYITYEKGHVIVCTGKEGQYKIFYTMDGKTIGLATKTDSVSICPVYSDGLIYRGNEKQFYDIDGNANEKINLDDLLKEQYGEDWEFAEGCVPYFKDGKCELVIKVEGKDPETIIIDKEGKVVEEGKGALSGDTPDEPTIPTEPKVCDKCETPLGEDSVCPKCKPELKLCEKCKKKPLVEGKCPECDKEPELKLCEKCKKNPLDDEGRCSECDKGQDLPKPTN